MTAAWFLYVDADSAGPPRPRHGTAIVVVPLVAAVGLAGCMGGDEGMGSVTRQTPKTVEVTSPVIQEGHAFPRQYTCQGADTSPPLDVRRLPPETEAIALVLDDPDAPNGTWLHWMFWDLPAETTTIPEGADIAGLGGTEGNNDFGNRGYGGPCPPGGTHEYHVKVYALDRRLDLDEGASLQELTQAMDGHTLAWGQMTATYTKT
jgi:Raf kinase inhibitor-like YbhB/YbcL family protein